MPLSSQLYPEAQRQSASQFGFKATHTSILEDDDVLEYVLDQIKRVTFIFPDSHYAKFAEGGYDTELSDDYSDMVKFVIKVAGKYLMALTKGELQPVHESQQSLVDAARGMKKPSTELEQGWVRFLGEYPDCASSDGLAQ